MKVLNKVEASQIRGGALADVFAAARDVFAAMTPVFSALKKLLGK